MFYYFYTPSPLYVLCFCKLMWAPQTPHGCFLCSSGRKLTYLRCCLIAKHPKCHSDTFYSPYIESRLFRCRNGDNDLSTGISLGP